MKKKLMKTTEKMPIPRLVITDAAEPKTEENMLGSKNFFNS